MTRALLPAVMLLAVLADVTPSAAQPAAPRNLAESQARAKAVLDAAIGIHGGTAALDAARQMRVCLTGRDLWRNQSRSAGAPYDAEPRRIDLMIDLRNGRIVYDGASNYPGGFHNAWRWVTDSAASYYIDHRSHTYRNTDYPPAATQTGNLFYLPQFLLMMANQNAASLRWLGRQQLSTGQEVDVIVARAEDGTVTLGFDPATKHLRALLNMGSDAVSGDVVYETEFTDYRMLDGVLLPARRISRTGGEVTLELAYTCVTPNYSVPDSLAVPPAQYQRAPPSEEAAPVRALAPGIWAIGTGSISLVVAFADHVMVVEAPLFGTTDLLPRIAELAPGKPVRYVAVTHHHDDHAGGVEHFAALGATLITTPESAALIARMASARTTLSPDLPPLSSAPRIEPLREARRVFTDGTRTVELHRVEGSPHANDMLVAWIPEHGILFQGDLLAASPQRGANNATTVHFAEWLARKKWDVRVFGGVHGFLADRAAYDALVKLPIVR